MRQLETMLRQVSAFLRQGRYDDARRILKDLRARHPHDPRVIRALSNLHQSLQEYDEAEKLLEEEIRRGRTAFLVELAEIHQAQGRTREVLKAILRYLDHHPSRHHWARDVIESLVRKKDLDDGDMAFLETEARKRDDPTALHLVADAHVFSGNHREGIRLLHEADVKAEARGKVLFPLAHVMQNREAPDLALEIIDLVLGRDPEEGLQEEALLTRARIFSDTGRDSAAVQAYEDMIERHPEGHLSRRALMEEAVILRDRLGDFSAARRAYKRLVSSLEKARGLPQKQKYLDEARLGLGECALWEGLWDEAESTFVTLQETAHSKDSREQATYYIAETRFFQGDFMGAEAGYYAVADSFPGGNWVNDSIQRILLLQEHALAPMEDLVGLTQVLLQRRRGSPDSALVLSRRYVENGRSGELTEEFLFEEVQSLLDLSRWEDAVSALRDWPDSLSQSQLAPRAYESVAKALVEDANRVDQGVSLYEELLLAYPHSLESRRARSRLIELRSSS
jgi:tetratricopeptide (TPR) repeat protein